LSSINLDNQILEGDCEKVMQSLEANSVDLVVTDPPYGYSFMGKDWDKAVPSVDIWKECLRVLKSGAFAFVMSSPRADVLAHMIVNLSDAGFRTDFTPIYWAYASGFPKAMNIGKAVDKRLGLEREVVGKIQPFGREGRSYQGVQNASEKILGGGWDVVKETKNGVDLTTPASTESKLLDGSYGGFQPKPAIEVIIVAMKPLSEKTFVDQALKNCHGLTWLDDARIPFQSEVDSNATERCNTKNSGRFKENPNCFGGYSVNNSYSTTQGRFPANLLVSDDCLNDGTIHITGGGVRNNKFQGVNTINLGLKPQIHEEQWDSGSFSRYFSLDAWFMKQFKKLPLEVQKTFPFLIEPKASKSERNTNLNHLDNGTYLDESRHDKEAIGCNNPRNRTGKLRQGNVHPTVKPLQLMSYLITLGSQPNDLILDPFVGSGTTCLAAKMLGRKYIGIELNSEYVKIAETRVNNHRTLFEIASNHAHSSSEGKQ
jgi:DNA modification methylase